MSSTHLIQTCLETGHLTLPEIEEALAGTKDRKEMIAVISFIEAAIADADDEICVKGQDPTIRTEAAGAARHLRELRANFIRLTAPKPLEKKNFNDE